MTDSPNAGVEKLHRTSCPKCGLGISADSAFCGHCGEPTGRGRVVPWWHLHRRLYDWVLAWAHKPSAAVALFLLSFAESSFFPIPPDVLLMPLALGNPGRWFRYALLCTAASVAGAVAGFLIGWLLWTGPFYFLVVFIAAVLSLPLTMLAFRRVRGFLGRAAPFAAALAVGAAAGGTVALLAYKGTVEELCFAAIPGFNRETFNHVSELYEKYNFWIVFTAAFTPIPFKLITISAGVFGTGTGVANPALFFAMFIVASIVGRSARFFLVSGLMRLFGAKITPFIDRYFNWLALAFTALLIGGFVAVRYFL